MTLEGFQTSLQIYLQPFVSPIEVFRRHLIEVVAGVGEAEKVVLSHFMGQIGISRVLFWRSDSYNGSYKGVTLMPDSFLLVKFVKLLFCWVCIS